MKQTEFNAAMSYNLKKNGVTGIAPNFTIDYGNAKISRGALASALNPQVITSNQGQVVFN